jgi:putative oxidoreductase
MDLMKSILILISRLCFSSVFLWAGAAMLFHWKDSVDSMKAKNMPSVLLPAAVVMQLLGGLSLLLGYQARIGAVILIVFIIPTAIKLHNFWSVADTERNIEKTLFMKDVAILGGLLLILAFGAGHFSFDGA